MFNTLGAPMADIVKLIHVASAFRRGFSGCDVAGLGIVERPDFIALDLARLDSAHGLVMEARADQPGIDQQLTRSTNGV